MDYSDHLRRLTVDGDISDADDAPDLDERTLSLVRLGALVCVAAAESSIRKEVDSAVAAGASPAQIVAVLDAISPIVGRPRIVKAAPKVAVALGDDLDLLESGSDL
ncbi:carboxymuconolactone decarboxylase family protein [Microbacterium kunmingense]|uniref:carboxymuconolactone decarboxylase family protein n=1 Tax=Microbacterium kunmingense TaxID=2915939 RepID=UPI003D75B980